jgi:hypothetical protein
VPPPKGAAYKGTVETGWEKERDDAIAAIHGFGGQSKFFSVKSEIFFS